jgi:hypothetical protein
MIPHLVLQYQPAAATTHWQWRPHAGNISFQGTLSSALQTTPLPEGLGQPVPAQRILPSGVYSIRLEQGRAGCEFKGKLCLRSVLLWHDRFASSRDRQPGNCACLLPPPLLHAAAACRRLQLPPPASVACLQGVQS